MLQLQHTAFGPNILSMPPRNYFLIEFMIYFSFTLQANIIIEKNTRTVLSSIIRYNKLI
jgi:hypothetical protein